MINKYYSHCRRLMNSMRIKNSKESIQQCNYVCMCVFVHTDAHKYPHFWANLRYITMHELDQDYQCYECVESYEVYKFYIIN